MHVSLALLPCCFLHMEMYPAIRVLKHSLAVSPNTAHIIKTMMRGGMGMISELVKAGAKAGTIGRMCLGATPSQRTIPRLCQRGMETQNSLMTTSLMPSCTREARTQVIIAFLIPRLISGLTGRARKHLSMAGDLDQFAVDGGLEQFLEYLKTKNGHSSTTGRGNGPNYKDD